MSGCHCGQAGSMFCESCSDLRCQELMQYKENIEKQKNIKNGEKTITKIIKKKLIIIKRIKRYKNYISIFYILNICIYL